MNQHTLLKIIRKRVTSSILFILLAAFTPLAALAYTETAEADFTPWSGWWWPSTSSGISTGLNYRGHPAPMEKYELLKDGAYPGPATNWDKSQYYQPEALSWNGRCEHWSAASVFEHITFFPSSIENIIFYVGDKKGLMTACHSGDNTLRVNPQTPDIFHNWLQNYIRDLGVDFYAELEPAASVWNYPVFKYQMDIQDNGSSLGVTCQIWYADDFVDEDYQGTQVLTQTYTYALYKSGDTITGGAWTGNSIYNRPSMLAIPLNQLTLNPYLDCDLAREIATHRDDELESTEPDIINPGKYNLILIDKDDYIIDAAKNDEISLGFYQIDDFSENIRVTMSDKDRKIVFFTYLSDQTETRRFTAENPPYNLSFTRNDYQGGGVYFLQYELKPAFEFADLKILKGFGWGGFAVTNPGDQSCENIRITGYDAEGLPIETYTGPFTLEPKQKRTFMASDFVPRAAEISEMMGIKITAPGRLNVLELTGFYGKNMTSFSDQGAHQTLVLPDTVSLGNSAKSISWGLYNTSSQDANIGMTLYSTSGQVSGTASLNLEAAHASHFDKLTSPFGNGIDNGWVLIEGGDQIELKGYGQWLINGLNKAEAIPLLSPGREFYAPHVAESGPWDTRLTLINITGENNSLTLTLLSPDELHENTLELGPYEKRELTISEAFPAADLLAINQSGLEITATLDMAGYYAFITSGDDIYYPFLTPADVKQSLEIAHVASDAHWWTGVNLLNPSADTSVECSIRAYDANGNHLPALDRTLNFLPYQKAVLTIEALYPENASLISSLVFSAQGEQGLLGLVGYGNSDLTMISGCKLNGSN